MKKLFRKNIHAALLVLLMSAVVACGGNTEKQSNDGQQAAADTASAPEVKLNINTTAGDKFRTIPNVGDKMVHEFEEYRPYVSIRQFRKEIGKYVDEAQVAKYEKYIFVPIHRNDSDAATVMQVPGLDESETEELLAGRPFESNQVFLDSLSSYVNEDELAMAESYLKSE